MKQIEYKVKDIKRELIAPFLDTFGASKTFEGEIITTYYDSKPLNFINSGKRLSMRTKGENTFLTFKNKYRDLEMSVSDEFEVEVTDPLAMNRILEGLGYEHFIKFHKNRLDYKIDNVSFSFDRYIGEYSHIPEFLTIEADNEAIIFYWAQELGIDRRRLEAISMLDLIKQYSNSRDNVEDSNANIFTPE
jgi:predicted adenylyl cyclase CyaB